MSVSTIARCAMTGLFAAVGLCGVPGALLAQIPETARTVPAEVPLGFTPDGDVLIHTASGFRFPAQVAGFTRMKERGSDPSGEYIAIGYERQLGRDDKIIVRIAIVHLVDMTAAEHYTIMKPVAMSHFSAVSVVSETKFSIGGQQHIPGYRGVFAGERDGHPWRFNLTTVDFGYWDGRLASAYPAVRASDAESALDGLLSAFRWQRPVTPVR
ncbi:hypothetical protein PX699_16185 [Sphingobium sp. H39-3-25]|uniref:hypothetical protein n=1 Tax=Sphingobium arseniciresistens TaxID=3030834 RepID=UPI0023B99B63|nr:hypothetical protein [Sphingobium arseniciresistens]